MDKDDVRKRMLDRMREPGTEEVSKAAHKPDATDKPLAKHTVVAGDSLSAIAMQHYGSAAKEKWMAIYEANKEIIGDNPSLIRVGQELTIPRLD